MAQEQLYVGGDSGTDDEVILTGLNYDPTQYYIASKRDGPSGGGGEDCCYVVIERKMGGEVDYDDSERTDI